MMCVNPELHVLAGVDLRGRHRWPLRSRSLEHDRDLGHIFAVGVGERAGLFNLKLIVGRQPTVNKVHALFRKVCIPSSTLMLSIALLPPAWKGGMEKMRSKLVKSAKMPLKSGKMLS